MATAHASTMIHGRSAGLAGPSKAQAVKPRGVARLKVSSRRPLLCLAKAAKQGESGWPTVYRSETSKLIQGLITRQAVKTALVFFGETNGQMHFWLHDYLSQNPITVDSHGAADEWLVKLACAPITKVKNPHRSSVVTATTLDQATNGEREVSPREIAERIMAVRVEIAREIGLDIDTERVAAQNQDMLRKALTCLVTDKPVLPKL